MNLPETTEQLNALWSLFLRLYRLLLKALLWAGEAYLKMWKMYTFITFLRDFLDEMYCIYKGFGI